MIVRELPQGYEEQRLTEEYQERLRMIVSEPGQKTLAYDLLGRVGNDPLTSMEIATLEKVSKPLLQDCESTSTLYEQGDEAMSAYGTLTYRGMITWLIKEGWLVCNITPLGTKSLVLLKKNETLV